MSAAEATISAVALLVVAGVATRVLAAPPLEEEPRPLAPFASAQLHRLRAFLALLVVVAHARALLWQDFGRLLQGEAVHAPWILAVYGITGFGSAAVVAFFVLSGFLITRIYLPGLIRGESPRSFALRRLTHLYVVLVPALVWTFCLGWLTSRSWVPHVPDANLGSAVGTLLFLQPQWARSFGGNLPLWSIGYEGAAYLLFALATTCAVALREGKRRRAAVLGLSFVGLLAFYGPHFWHYLGLWTVGALAAAPSLLRVRTSSPRLTRYALLGGAAVAVLGALFGRMGVSYLVRDWVVAIGVGVVSAALDGAPTDAQGAPAPWARALSGFSFTLYVTHYPLLVLASSLALGLKAAPSLPSLGALLAAITLAVAAAALLSWLTEARTGAVRCWLDAKLLATTRLRQARSMRTETTRAKTDAP